MIKDVSEEIPEKRGLGLEMEPEQDEQALLELESMQRAPWGIMLETARTSHVTSLGLSSPIYEMGALN